MISLDSTPIIDHLDCTDDALDLLIRCVAEGRTVFYCTDSDEYTIAVRCASILSRDSVDAVEEQLVKDDRAYSAMLGRLSGVGWSYGELDEDGLALRLRAFEAVYGKTPDVVFVDSGQAGVEIRCNYRDVDTPVRA